MKPLNQLAAIFLGLVFAATAVQAQEQYTIQMHGAFASTNENGALLKRKFNNQTFYRECIADLGLTNRPKLRLVYHVGGDFNGDVIEVQNARTGEVLCQKLRVLFPTTLSNASGNEIHQRVHVFTMEPGDPIGEGKVVQKTTKGTTKISGQLIFVLPAEGTNALRICNTSFSTIRRINN